MNVSVSRASIRPINVTSEGDNGTKVPFRVSFAAVPRYFLLEGLVGLGGDNFWYACVVSSLVNGQVGSVGASSRARRVRLNAQVAFCPNYVASVARCLVLGDLLRAFEDDFGRFCLSTHGQVGLDPIATCRVKRCEA